MKARLTKTQIKMLIEGKTISDGRLKYAADENLKKALRLIDERDAYHLLDVIVENGCISVTEKK
ncbi:hypothetical protein [Hungatella hathewayi]|uniref:hypothetical protein n=1 Tax=Hungatella hathewayi TaxID=154046 RepID=UPI00356538B0